MAGRKWCVKKKLTLMDEDADLFHCGHGYSGGILTFVGTVGK
jgi:hypothetical protein